MMALGVLGVVMMLAMLNLPSEITGAPEPSMGDWDIRVDFDANGGTDAPEPVTLMAQIKGTGIYHIIWQSAVFSTPDHDLDDFPEQQPIRPGCDFLGWSLYDDNDPSNILSTNGLTVLYDDILEENQESITLYAVWDMTSTPLEFLSNPGDGTITFTR